MAFVAVTAAVAPVADLEMQVEIGFLVGASVSTLVMAFSLAVRMRKGVAEGVGSLIDQIEHEPLEI